MTERLSDCVIEALREEVGLADRELVRLMNRRLLAVSALRTYKQKRGIPLDAVRERDVREEIREANAGPLSPEG